MEKTFADCSLVRLPRKFTEKTFLNSYKTLKFVKVFSLKSFHYTVHIHLPHAPDNSMHTHTHVQVTLEFFERKKSRWLLPAETVNWEVWHLMVTVVEPGNQQGR